MIYFNNLKEMNKENKKTKKVIYKTADILYDRFNTCLHRKYIYFIKYHFCSVFETLFDNEALLHAMLPSNPFAVTKEFNLCTFCLSR